MDRLRRRWRRREWPRRRWLRRRLKRRAEERKICAFNADQAELRGLAERAQVVANAVITELERRPIPVSVNLQGLENDLQAWGRHGWKQFVVEVAKEVRKGLEEKP